MQLSRTQTPMTANGGLAPGVAIAAPRGRRRVAGSLGRMKSSSSLTVMITSAVPIIAVSDSARAEDYYCRVLGFQKMFAYPLEASQPDPRYLGVARDGVWLHLQSFKPERAGMTDAFLWVADVDL